MGMPFFRKYYVELHDRLDGTGKRAIVVFPKKESCDFGDIGGFSTDDDDVW